MREEDLTPVERRVLAAFRRDEELDLRVGSPRVDDPANGATWDPGRILRAEALAWILSTELPEDDGELGNRAALRVTGAAIRGVIDLDYAVIRYPLRLTACHISDPIRLYGARARHIALVNCHLTHFYAANLEVDGTLRLSRCSAHGLVRLSGARVSALLVLDGTRIVAAPDLRPGISNAATADVALDADRMRIGGNVWLRNGFTTRGAAILQGSQIEGDLLLGGARLSNPMGRSLAAARIRVGGNVEAHGLESTGQLELDGSNAAGSIEFERSVFSNPGGVSFTAEGVTTALGLGLEDTVIEGSARLTDADTNRLSLFGASVRAQDTPALDLRRLRVRYLDMRVKAAPTGRVDLRHASADVVAWGASAVWPTELKLDGMVCSRLVEPLPAAEQVQLLLRDGEGYVPQPFEQLARVYKDHGHEDEARAVLLAKEKLRHSRMPWYARSWGLVQEATVGYGYRPSRAGLWLLVLLAIGTAVFTVAPARRTPSAGDQTFSPLIFTLDHLMPVIQFGQGSGFTPSPGTQWFAYGLTAAGWLLATAIATGVARSVNRL